MNTLEDAWTWYQGAKLQLGLVSRLASEYWEDLPWQGDLGRDDRFKGLERKKLEEDARSTLGQIDDLAVLVLFSVFESQVRERLAVELKREVLEKSVSHSVSLEAVDDLIRQVEEGSFFKVLSPFKRLDHNLVEEVNQVRRYRNWAAHGKRGKTPSAVDPRSAYDRLTRFWELIQAQTAESEGAGSQ